MGNVRKESTSVEQKSEQTGKYLQRCIFFLGIIMILNTIIASKANFKNAESWGVLVNTGCVAFIYLSMIYFQYVCFPNKQKRLKAIIDGFANLLALSATILTFITIVLFKKPENLNSILASFLPGSIIFGIITGVLLSRILFPFWDLYSPYKSK